MSCARAAQGCNSLSPTAGMTASPRNPDMERPARLRPRRTRRPARDSSCGPSRPTRRRRCCRCLSGPAATQALCWSRASVLPLGGARKFHSRHRPRRPPSRQRRQRAGQGPRSGCAPGRARLARANRGCVLRRCRRTAPRAKRTNPIRARRASTTAPHQGLQKPQGGAEAAVKRSGAGRAPDCIRRQAVRTEACGKRRWTTKGCLKLGSPPEACVPRASLGVVGLTQS